MEMDLNDFLGPKPIVIDLQAENRWQAIDDEHGHWIWCRTAARFDRFGSEVIGAIGHSRKGVQFEALDGKPVHRVILFLIPQGQFQKHLYTLANLPKMLHGDNLL